MTSPSAASPSARLFSSAGLGVEINANGSICRMSHGDTTLNLFVGNEVEGGAGNLYLRRPGEQVQYTELLGPCSPTRFHPPAQSGRLVGTGEWQGLRYTIAMVLAEAAPAWFWHLSIENVGAAAQEFDLIYAQDIALAPYGTVRLNEYYVSQYVDHTPLLHAVHGYVVASRQNLAAQGRNPWCVIGSLRYGKSFATDAMQVHRLASRAGAAPVGIVEGLPGHRLQHEHSMVAIQDSPSRIKPGERVSAGFFGWLSPDHAAATSSADLECIERAMKLPEAGIDLDEAGRTSAPSAAATLFSVAPRVAALDLDQSQLSSRFGSQWRHEETDEKGRRLSFFHGADRHVVLRAKELQVQRPHGHMLRTGRHVTPDEKSLTSTVWMNGVFHSMLTEGHVSFNRLLSTVHSYLGLFRSHGQRVFAEIDGKWQLLDVPSAFEMQPDACRWIYRHAGGEIEVRSEALAEAHELTLAIDVRSGPPTRFLISHHVALNGDDGSSPGPACWRRDDAGIVVFPAADSEIGRRFPGGGFHIAPIGATSFENVGGDELLFVDGESRRQPYLCIVTTPATSIGLSIRGGLISESSDIPGPRTRQSVELLRIDPPSGSSLAAHVVRAADILPWFQHSALVHYLSPRGLEQYSGGGWGTRDVTQGPVEMLLALGHTAPVRDLLLRVMGAQAPDGDWPQWFMFFERERAIRAGDSHGDIVFWPVLALAQYLIASGDGALLDEKVPFFAADPRSSELGTVWQHVERALEVIRHRLIGGTALAAYGHGDWNDALQPADPAMRERMCSAWTVTLHHQTLVTLAHALRAIGRGADAPRFEEWARNVRRDFQQVLVVDNVLTGYASFEENGDVRYLLHPRDGTTGVRYSALAMIHAILEDMLSPEQVRHHLQLIDDHLSGPDGVRLFDRPMNYHGGPQRFFQRAESATFFGREIGLMYMHAHLRYAQALAHLGEVERFFRALCQVNPIGIRSLVPSASLRQANCYYSSSDAAFADRYHASAEYHRVAAGKVQLDGGWRVYSSGAGIGLSLIVRRFLGLSIEAGAVCLDPVIPAALNGLRVQMNLFDRPVELIYDIATKGCGVTSVQINDQPMPLSHDANPYRRGVARMARAAFIGQLRREGNVVRIGLE